MKSGYIISCGSCCGENWVCPLSHSKAFYQGESVKDVQPPEHAIISAHGCYWQNLSWGGGVVLAARVVKMLTYTGGSVFITALSVVILTPPHQTTTTKHLLLQKLLTVLHHFLVRKRIKWKQGIYKSQRSISREGNYVGIMDFSYEKTKWKKNICAYRPQTIPLFSVLNECVYLF